MSPRATRAAFFVVAALLPGCQSLTTDRPKALAELHSTTGNDTTGRARFTEVSEGVQVHAVITGLRPSSEHGFHIDEVGDCSAADGASAGVRFTPRSEPHGHYRARAHHPVDLPNLKADYSGRAETVFVLGDASLQPGPTSLLGRALFVHAQPDDHRAHPAGNPGARLACGVIRQD